MPECRVPGGRQIPCGENVVPRNYSSILGSIRYRSGGCLCVQNRQARCSTGTKAAGEGRGRGSDPPEAEALTAKAAELMARYGIDRARLAATRPDTDRPGSRVIDISNPWAQVRAHLLAGLAGAMRCQCVLLSTNGPGARIHVFGYASDLERADILYTSLLLQMAHGLTRPSFRPGSAAPGPGGGAGCSASSPLSSAGSNPPKSARPRARRGKPTRARARPSSSPTGRSSSAVSWKRPTR